IDCSICNVVHYYFHRLFSYNHPTPTAIYTLSLHDALPICVTLITTVTPAASLDMLFVAAQNLRMLRELATSANSGRRRTACRGRDRKSTRLNSSHDQISYAVFCLKKKNTNIHAASLATCMY